MTVPVAKCDALSSALISSKVWLIADIFSSCWAIFKANWGSIPKECALLSSTLSDWSSDTILYQQQ